MEVFHLRSALLNSAKLVQLANQTSRTSFRPLHSSLSVFQTKKPEAKPQLHSSVQRLHTPAEQLRYSSARPKPQPLEYPDETDEARPSLQPRPKILTADTISDLQHDSKPVAQKRPLAVVIAWLGAKPKNVNKYSQIWTERGFDVITESIDAFELLLPKQRAIPRIHRLVQVLYDLASSGRHEEIVLHCFSVGGYVFGEMLRQLITEETRQQIQGTNAEDPRQILQKAIKGLIFDSLVNLDGIGQGVSRSLTTNPVLAQLIKRTIDLHLMLSHNFATKYYLQSSDHAHYQNLFRVPSMFFFSDADYIGTPAMSHKLAGIWKQDGVPITLKHFENSEHVRHYVQHPEVYKAAIDQFLQQLDLQAFKAN